MENIISFHNVTKSFASFFANKDISFSIRQNSIHSIIGENGAGKTTLMKILFGIYKKDSGEIFIHNKPIEFNSPLDAISSGIGMLHQHFQLIEDFTVWENVILGSEISQSFFLDNKKIFLELNDLISRYNLGINLEKKLSECSISEKQKIEILKLLFRKSEILIFDEPTAVLSPYEVKEFFKIIRKFKDEGKTIIFITHKLKEIQELSDKVTVLRKGEVVYEVNSAELDLELLSKNMIGKVPGKNELNKSIWDKDQNIILSLENIVYTSNGINLLNNFSMKVSAGSIYGLCGVDGNGQNELVKLILGHIAADRGFLNYEGNEIAIVPDDRINKGMIKDWSIGENVLLRSKKYFYFKSEIINAESEKIVEEFEVRVPDENVPLSSLSGGNQQKVIFGREYELETNLFILVHPTRGVDINAANFIHSKIIEKRNSGSAIIIISSDLDELLKLSDKLGVIYNGKIIKEFNNFELDYVNEEIKEQLIIQIGKYMIGIEE